MSAEISIYSMNEGQLQSTANTVKDSVVRAMKKEGVLPPDCDWDETHVIIVHPKGWFGRVVDALLFRDGEKGLAVSVAKLVFQGAHAQSKGSGK